GADGKPTQYAFAPGWCDLTAQCFVYSSGSKFLDDESDPTKLLYDDPNVVKCYQFLADLMLKQKWIPTPTELSTVLQSNPDKLFAEQKVAMIQSGIWEVPSIRKSLVPGEPGFFDWDITLFPA